MCDISIFLTADGQFDLQSYAATYDMDSNYGKNWIEYKSPNNPLLYSDPNLLRSTSLAHVNFIRNQATVTLKDARVTFADMIGTIGGNIWCFHRIVICWYIRIFHLDMELDQRNVDTKKKVLTFLERNSFLLQSLRNKC